MNRVAAEALVFGESLEIDENHAFREERSLWLCFGEMLTGN